MSDYQFSPDQEQWKEIPGYPTYQVSDHGNARSVKQFASSGYKIKNLSIIVDKRGYSRIPVRKNGKPKLVSLHRVILIAFRGDCPPGHESCHNDGDPTNNFLYNLRWDTLSKNWCDRFQHGTATTGTTNPSAKLTVDEVIEIRKLHKTGHSLSHLSDKYNICRSNVHSIVTNKTWKYV